MCADERQWLPPGGQRWTTLAELTAAGHASDVRAVEPGLTLTDSVDRMIPPDVLEQMSSAIPLGRAVYAREIADAFVYLATASKTTAAVITVDGGNIEASLR